MDKAPGRSAVMRKDMLSFYRRNRGVGAEKAVGPGSLVYQVGGPIPNKPTRFILP